MNEGIDGVHDSDEDEIEMGKARSPDCGGGLLPRDVISYSAHWSTNLAVAPIFCESHFFFFSFFVIPILTKKFVAHRILLF